MSKLTGTHSEVSEIDFTTLTTVPGTVKVHGAPIQILDLRTFIFFHFITSLPNLSSQLVLSKVPTMAVVEVNKVRTVFTLNNTILYPYPSQSSLVRTSTYATSNHQPNQRDNSRPNVQPHLHRPRCAKTPWR